MNAEELRELYDGHYAESTRGIKSGELSRSRITIQRVLRYIAERGFQVTSGMKVLDVGCGKGYFAEALRLAGFEACGLDYSEVALGHALSNFPSCKFVHMDGFEPRFPSHFDLIFIKGFSGVNTHDLDFIASLLNKYVRLLQREGVLVMGFKCNMSGKESSEDETVNWSRPEIQEFSSKVAAEWLGMFSPAYTLRELLVNLRHPYGLVKRLLRRVQKPTLFKPWWYLCYRKPRHPDKTP